MNSENLIGWKCGGGSGGGGGGDGGKGSPMSLGGSGGGINPGGRPLIPPRPLGSIYGCIRPMPRLQIDKYFIVVNVQFYVMILFFFL